MSNWLYENSPGGNGCASASAFFLNGHMACEILEIVIRPAHFARILTRRCAIFLGSTPDRLFSINRSPKVEGTLRVPSRHSTKATLPVPQPHLFTRKTHASLEAPAEGWAAVNQHSVAGLARH